MLDQEQIDAFITDNEAAMEAAREFSRRAKKGLPPDRFSDGTTGAKLVAKGIDAWMTAYGLAAQAFLNLYEDSRRASDDAIRLHHADSKYTE